MNFNSNTINFVKCIKLLNDKQYTGKILIVNIDIKISWNLKQVNYIRSLDYAWTVETVMFKINN